MKEKELKIGDVYRLRNINVKVLNLIKETITCKGKTTVKEFALVKQVNNHWAWKELINEFVISED